MKETRLMKVKYNWTNRPMFTFMQDEFITEYLRLYNMAVEEFNDKIGEWNKQFFEKYPDRTIDADNPEDLYNTFIRERYLKIIDSVNEKSGWILELGLDEYVGIIGIGKTIFKGVRLGTYVVFE